MQPRFSIIIPAYNEAALLPRLLATIRAAAASATADVQVIVANNASTDATAELALASGAQVVDVSQRCIAAARNGGAAAASGDVLCFVDADMQIHPDTFTAIDAALANPKVVAGASGVTLERWSLGLAVTFASMLPMIWLSGMDTGAVFCRRADFESLGGYDDTLLVAEDVAFLLALRRVGRPRGQRLARLRNAKAIASTRKFDQFGDWHYFGLMWQGMKHLLGRGDAEYTDRYWYRPKR